MAMLKFIQIAILFGLLSVGLSSDQCEDDLLNFDTKSEKEVEQELSETDIKKIEYDTAVKELGGKTELESDHAALLKLSRKTYSSVDDIKIPETESDTKPVSEPLCKSHFYRWWIGGRVIFPGGNTCYVLRPWWYQVFTSLSYATCRRQSCQHMPTCNKPNWIQPYRWGCEPTNYKTFFIWLYCPGFGYWRFPVRRPQCCECKRKRVFFPSDFTAIAPQT